MKIDDKELLLRDLCGRLPYWVKCIVKTVWYIGVISSIESQYGIATFDNGRQEEICDIKPCLYPLSSMTKEQRKEYYAMVKYNITSNDNAKLMDWLNKNHFDYRGLIARCLAIDATGLNIYKEETK